jgi:hypothetical protein
MRCFWIDVRFVRLPEPFPRGRGRFDARHDAGVVLAVEPECGALMLRDSGRLLCDIAKAADRRGEVISSRPVRRLLVNTQAKGIQADEQ